MLRAAIMRKLSNGLFAYLPLGLRVFRKVEQIIREEIDAMGGLEIKPPVVVPGELWRESGRWDTMGDAMLKAVNRVKQELVISPTAEEAVTAIVRGELASYKQLPLHLYQINTKYRDEIRPRYGVMRGREFMMFDGYSYHTDDASLDETYQKMATAYRRIFARLGLSIIPVRADSGAMGGSGSEEFMVESDVGDDTLMLCPKCGYAANLEKATCQADDTAAAATTSAYEKIDTPRVKSIDELCAFLKTDAKVFIKTLIYRAENCAEPFVAVCIRGDLDVNETKLANAIQASEVALADDADVERITGAPVGFAGPVGLKGVTIVVDTTVTKLHDAVTGALEVDKHFVHVEPDRDFPLTSADGSIKTADVRTVKAGDPCPECGAGLYTKKGNELGHIFKLGRKYTDALHVTYLDENGKTQVPTMGCYGIGVDRSLASVIEEHHDDAGIIWPMTVAPYHVVIVPIKYEGAMKEAADRLHAELTAAGIEVLLDDRDERPGVKFNDADLLGFPLRLVVGAKNLPNIEVKLRCEKDASLVPLGDCAALMSKTVKDALAALEP